MIWPQSWYKKFGKVKSDLKKDVGAKMITGTYTGDGSSSKAVSLGFRPKFVMIIAHAAGNPDNYYYSAVTIDGLNTSGNRTALVSSNDSGFAANYSELIQLGTDITITDDGFTVTGMANGNGNTYFYIAMG